MKSRIHLFLSVLTFLFLMLFLSLKSYAFDYTITFTGTGASTTVESVIVQNLTKSTTVTVPAGNTLNLSDIATSVYSLSIDQGISIYPNPMQGKATVSFFAKQPGSTQLNAFSIDGRKIAGITENLQTGVNSFQLSLPKGAFSIQVVGNGYSYTAKMINQTGIERKPEIAYSGTVKPATSNPQKSKSFIPGITTMTYTTGDQLLYKAVSGNYSTIVTDIPTESKNMNFDFVTCQDADLNNYSVVTIGTQTWMVENLKTTKYNDGTAIPLITDNTAWWNLTTSAYCWYNNDATANKNRYGALYNWYAVNTAKLAPVGWHVPTDTEWTTLANYLVANGYNYDGTTSGNKIAKSLAATTNWYSNTGPGTIGNDLTKNNSSGFSALPGGDRGYYGTFYDINSYGFWWSSTVSATAGAWTRYLYYITNYLSRSDGTKSNGFSVRCVRDTIPTITDIDGNVYQTITIGTQTWMASNLRVTHYRDGNSIANVTDNAAWTVSTGAWCDYSNLATNGTKYGHLYNWYAVADSRKIAPVGWHVATYAEWITLITYLGGIDVAGGKLKEAGTLNWTSNPEATNETGFSALPGGVRGNGGMFWGVGGYGIWWCSTEKIAPGYAWNMVMYDHNSYVDQNFDEEAFGFSVRCVKDY